MTLDYGALAVSVAALIISVVNGLVIVLRNRPRVWKVGPPLIPPTRPSKETLAAIDSAADVLRQEREWKAAHPGWASNVGGSR